MPEVFFFGKILRQHGLKGYWLVKLNTITPVDFFNIKFLFVDIEGLNVPFFIKNFKVFSNNRLLISFYESGDHREDLTHNFLYLPITNLPITFESRFNDRSIIGFHVEDIQKGPIGVLFDINDQSYQKRFDIRFNGKQVWVPVVKGFIIELNRKKQLLLLNCPEGLLDLYI